MNIPFALAFAVATVLAVGLRSLSGRRYIQNFILHFRFCAPAPEESYPGREEPSRPHLIEVALTNFELRNIAVEISSGWISC